MTHSATLYVDAQATTAPASVGAAGFGTPMLLHEDTVSTSSRLHGPFTAAQDVVDFGYTSGSPPHLWAQALMSQPAKVSQFYIGRRDSGDADDGEAFTNVLASNPGAWYAVNSALRDSSEILALRAAVDSAAFPKIAIVQSNDASLLAGTGQAWSVLGAGTVADGDLTLTFTGYGLVTPVDVTATRAGGSPAALTDLVEDLYDALVTAAGGGGALEGILVPDSIVQDGLTITFSIVDGIATGAVTAAADATMTLTPTLVDGDIGSELFTLQSDRLALIYHPTDGEYLDGAWTSSGLSFDLDSKKGIWAYRDLQGVPGTNLTNAQVNALRAVNVNYFAPSVSNAGQATRSFTAQGWTASGLAGAGQRLDIRITIDWALARFQEAFLRTMLSHPSGVPMTDKGIGLYISDAVGVMGVGVSAGHFLRDHLVTATEAPIVGLPEGTVTPHVSGPRVATLTPTQRSARALQLQGVAYLAHYIEAVNFTLNLRN